MKKPKKIYKIGRGISLLNYYLSRIHAIKSPIVMALKPTPEKVLKEMIMKSKFLHPLWPLSFPAQIVDLLIATDMKCLFDSTQKISSLQAPQGNPYQKRKFRIKVTKNQSSGSKNKMRMLVITLTIREIVRIQGIKMMILWTLRQMEFLILEVLQRVRSKSLRSLLFVLMKVTIFLSIRILLHFSNLFKKSQNKKVIKNSQDHISEEQAVGSLFKSLQNKSQSF